MAIKKTGSREADRVKIKRMNGEGFSVNQIATQLSIVPEHVEYVLSGVFDDWKKKQAESKKLSERDRIRAELLEEMGLNVEKSPESQEAPAPAEPDEAEAVTEAPTEKPRRARIKREE